MQKRYIYFMLCPKITYFALQVDFTSYRIAAIFDLSIAATRGQISIVCRRIWNPNTQITQILKVIAVETENCTKLK